MSSGEILILPAAVVAAAGAVVVLTAAAAAVLAVRAASAAAEGAVRALGHYGEQLETAAGEQHDAEIRAQVWETIAAGVIELNARIRMLAERASRANVMLAVPKPLSLNGCTVTSAAAWSAQAARSLCSAQETLHAAVAADQWRQAAARLPQSAAVEPGTADAFARFQRALVERHAPEPVAHIDPSAAVETVLQDLDLDANERERADVLAAATLVAKDDRREAAAYLRALQAKIAAVNDGVARRRLAAQWVSALEDPIVVRTDPPRPFVDTAARLRAVVAGEEDLSPQLRAEGAEAVEWAAEVARQHFVRDMMRGCLSDLGYTVEAEFDLQHSAELRLTRPAWHDEHSAEVWVDQHGTVHGRLVREDGSNGDEATASDRSRCADFNADLVTLGDRLHADVETGDGYIPQRRNPAQAAEAKSASSQTQRYH